MVVQPTFEFLVLASDGKISLIGVDLVFFFFPIYIDYCDTD